MTKKNSSLPEVFCSYVEFNNTFRHRQTRSMNDIQYVYVHEKTALVSIMAYSIQNTVQTSVKFLQLNLAHIRTSCAKIRGNLT